MQKILRSIRFLIISILACLASYALAALLLGLLPVNRDFREAQEGVDIYIHASAVHADIVLPVQSASHDWRNVFAAPGIDAAEYVAIGWGDRQFYLETRSWSDLTVHNAANALSGLDRTLLHVSAEAKPREAQDVIRIRITQDQLRTLIQYVDASLARDADGHAEPVIGAHYGNNDGFYAARGRYSMFVTCNQWVRSGLSLAGIRTAVWSPFSMALLFHAREIRMP